MAIPQAAFLDTSIFAGQQYNYSSASLKAFVSVANRSKVKILLPDPTSREIRRQINERSAEALKALEDARRKAPFLSKWRHFPPKDTSLAKWEVGNVALSEWRIFLEQFEVEELGYEGVSISKIMNWYDSMRAPFGSGRKRKEFPDAFAIEIVSKYSERHDVCVAVVSDDHDLQKACEHYPSLLYFNSLAQLTELLLSGESRLEELQSILSGNLEILEDPIDEALSQMETYFFDDGYVEQDRSIENLQINELRIVGVGNSECTVALSISFDSNHNIAWDEVVDPTEGYMESRSEWIKQYNSTSGTAKFAIDSKLKKISSVVMIELDISEIELRRLPHKY